MIRTEDDVEWAALSMAATHAAREAHGNDDDADAGSVATRTDRGPTTVEKSNGAARRVARGAKKATDRDATGSGVDHYARRPATHAPPSPHAFKFDADGWTTPIADAGAAAAAAAAVSPEVSAHTSRSDGDASDAFAELRRAWQPRNAKHARRWERSSPEPNPFARAPQPVAAMPRALPRAGPVDVEFAGIGDVVRKFYAETGFVATAAAAAAATGLTPTAVDGGVSVSGIWLCTIVTLIAMAVVATIAATCDRGARPTEHSRDCLCAMHHPGRQRRRRPGIDGDLESDRAGHSDRADVWGDDSGEFATEPPDFSPNGDGSEPNDFDGDRDDGADGADDDAVDLDPTGPAEEEEEEEDPTVFPALEPNASIQTSVPRGGDGASAADDDRKDKKCVVCMDAEAVCVGVPARHEANPCGHISTCVACSAQLVENARRDGEPAACPMCRAKLSQFMRCYSV